MISRLTISEEELSAFIDGELDTTRHAEIEAVLADNAALAEHANLLRDDKARLVEIYGPLTNMPLPESWRARIGGQSRHRGLILSYRAIASIAATLLVAIGATVAWRDYLAPQRRDIVDLALDARAEVVRPESVIAHASQAEASMAVSNALHMRVTSPDLSRLGYTLTRVQIYAGAPGERPVELVYSKTGLQDVTLYVRHPLHALPANSRTIGVQMVRKGDVLVCAWRGEALDAVVAGRMSAPEMLRIASLSYSLPL